MWGQQKTSAKHPQLQPLSQHFSFINAHKKMTDLPCEVENRDTGWEEEEETKESERKYTAWESDNLTQEF